MKQNTASVLWVLALKVVVILILFGLPANILYWSIALFRGPAQNPKIAEEAKAFGGDLSHYLQYDELEDYTDTPPYIKGKVLPVEYETKQLSPLFYALPDNLRPSVPDEVGMVAAVSCKAELAGFYTGSGQPGAVYKCRMSLIDRAVPAIIAREDFNGSLPPRSIKTSSTPVYGTRPDGKFAAYLASIKSGKKMVFVDDRPVGFREEQDRNQLLSMAMIGGSAVSFLAIAGYLATMRAKRRMRRELGQDVENEYQLTSISSWMKAPKN